MHVSYIGAMETETYLIAKCSAPTQYRWMSTVTSQPTRFILTLSQCI